MTKLLITLSFTLIYNQIIAQSGIIKGIVYIENQPVEFVNIGFFGTSIGTITNEHGEFIIENITKGNYMLIASYMGYEEYKKEISIEDGHQIELKIYLKEISTQLDEVVITGVTKATLIRENPISIIAITSKQLETSSGNNIVDNLAKFVPGLNVVKTGPNISKPFIHGLGYNRVLTIYDGIRQEGQQWGDEHGLEVDNYNIEKAEIIKGPASIMYGSDALAGVVSLFPNIPKKEDGKIHGNYTTEFQTNNSLIGNGLRLEYNNKKYIIALRGSYRLAKNYKNSIDGRVYLSNFDEKNFSTLFGYKSKNGFTHFNFTLYNNKQGIPDGSRDSLSRKFTKQIYEGNDDLIKNRPILSEHELNSFKIPTLSQHIQHYRAYIHSFYKIRKGEIDAILGIQQNRRREYTHPTIPKQAGMSVRLNTLNYGIRYNAPTLKNIELSVGINGMFQSNKNLDATDFPIPNYNLYESGIYIYCKWKKDKWTISGGIRYDIRKVKWNDFYIGTNPITGFNQHLNANSQNAKLQFESYQKIFHGISLSLGSTFRVSPNISMKANIGRAYRSPNITEMSSNGLDPGAHIIYLGNRNFNPEFSLQEDIGINGKFLNFSFDASIFNNNIQNFIYLTLVVDAQGNPLKDAQGNKTYQYQQSKAHLYGGEMSLSIHPQKLKGFRLDNSLSLVYGLNKRVEYKNKGIAGEYLPLIPPLKITSGISHEFRIKTKRLVSFTPTIDLEYNISQKKYLGLNETETKTPSYFLFNTGLNIEFSYSEKNSIQFVFQINNLLDKAYQSHLNRLKYFEYYLKSTNNNLGIQNMGRNFVLKMIFPF